MERIRMWVNTTDFPSRFKCFILFFDGLRKKLWHCDMVLNECRGNIKGNYIRNGGGVKGLNR